MQDLMEKAKELGIDKISVTHAQPFHDEYKNGLDLQLQGLYPKFVETDLNLRTNPAAILSSVRSIISVAIAYKSTAPSLEPLSGQLSRYAWGEDYHNILYLRLESLVTWLRKAYGIVDYYIAVDSKPPIDRAIALRAGLGWIGQNCSVFVPPYGSWVFLGEILVDQELPSISSPVQKPSCVADCGRCVKACPTNALYEPYKINPHICISYLTQMKGMVPRYLRPKLGTKLWGCDICQQVCPHNQKAPASNNDCFYPIEKTSIPLIPLLTISKKSFQQRFGHTALAWRGRGLLQRNAALILGNIGDPQAINGLSDALKDPKPVVRASAIWALTKINTSRSQELVAKAVDYETDPLVLAEVESSS